MTIVKTRVFDNPLARNSGDSGGAVDEILYFDSFAEFPGTGVANTYYVDTSTDPSLVYIWDTDIEQYVPLGDGGILGDIASLNFIPQITELAGGKIRKLGNSAISDIAGLFLIALAEAGYMAGNRASGAIGLFGNSTESHISVGGSTSAGGGYTRIHSLIQNLVTGTPFTFSGIASIVANEIAVFNANGQLVSQKRVIPITYAQATTLSNSSLIVSGQQYLITDAADLGIVVVGSPNPQQFLTQALGGFLNADYQFVGDYDLIASVTGLAVGAFHGVWRGANEAALENGDIVIWNNLIFQIIDKAEFDGSNPLSNPDAYQDFLRANFAIQRVGYIQEWDSIQYNFATDVIQWRFDKRDNCINESSMANFQFGNDLLNWQQQDNFCVIDCLNNRGIIRGFQDLASTVYCSSNDGDINICSYAKGEFTINLIAGKSHTRCSSSINGTIIFNSSSDQFNKILTDNYSTFEEDIIITGLSSIDFSTVSYAGILNLLTTNASETINTLDFSAAALQNIFKVKLRNKIDGIYIASDIEFTDGVGNILINRVLVPAGSFTVLGTATPNMDFAEFELYHSTGNALLTLGFNN